MAKKAKVIVAIACQDTVKSKTMFSLIHALKTGDFDYDFIMRMGCDLIGSRTGLLKMALEMKDATHMLFLDHDMYFPPLKTPDGKLHSPIQRLLDQEKDIIGAPYNFRQLPPKCTAVPLDENCDKEKPYKCSVIATGFMLIDLSIVKDIPEPWFQFGRDANAELVYGEDTFFCQQAIKAGFEVWADPTLQVKHIGEYLY